MRHPDGIAQTMTLRLKRLLTPPFILLAAFVLWFWEWLWEPLERLMEYIGQLPLLHQLEGWIAKAPPVLALLCFFIPGAALLPFKLAGVYFIAHGAPLLGIATFLAAKLVGTALVARIFSLTKPQLLQIGWFARLYTRVTAFRDRVFAALHAHPLYQRIHAALCALRGRVRQVRRGLMYHLTRRWRAVMRYRRREGDT